MRTLGIALVVWSLWAAPVGAQPSPKTSGVTFATVSVSAANQAVQACASQVDGCSISLPPDSPSGVWFFILNEGTACTAITQRRGIYIERPGGYTCSPYEPGGYCYNWKGKSCMILNAAGGAVSAEVTQR